MTDVAGVCPPMAHLPSPPGGGPCPYCGRVRCVGTSKQTHDRCKLPPSPGLTVCRFHGAKAPQVQQAGRTREVERRARVELEKQWAHGTEVPVADPLAELARVAGEIVAFKDYLRAQVDQLDGLLTYWQEKEYTDMDGEVQWTKAAEDVRAIVAAYERALDRTAKVLAAMVKLDLQGRLVAVREAQATLIVDAIREGLSDVDMGMTVRRAAEAAIADKLEALARRHPNELPTGT